MTTTLGITAMALGLAYVTLAGVALSELLGGFRSRGFSRFGVGLVVMGMACGAHHIVHGLHAVTGGGASAPAMVATVLGLPAVLTFIVLRLEVMTGGRGDRFIAGTPRWISLTPIVFLIVAGVLVDRSLQEAFESPVATHHGAAGGISWAVMLPNLFIALSYAVVGWHLLRTQVRRREEQGGWSLSGLALGAVFPTCSLMHLVVALDQPHGSAVVGLDMIGVPISIYFLWVVNGLHRQALVDWNRRPLAGDPGRPDRMSPWDHPGATAN